MNATTTRFGTSSWAYEGWHGLVYHRTYPKSRFSQDTLAEYAAYCTHGSPLFSTVGIDHSFYRPASAKQLAHYAEQVPDEFRFCQKVWEDITVPAYANLPRYGAKAGKPNPRFLDIGAFHDLVLQPALGRSSAPSSSSFSAGDSIQPSSCSNSTGFSNNCHPALPTQSR
jgi:hypothetical protein